MINEYIRVMQSNSKLRDNHLDKTRILFDSIKRIRAKVRERVPFFSLENELVSLLIYIKNGVNYLAMEEKLLLDVGVFIIICENNLDCLSKKRKKKGQEYILKCGPSVSQRFSGSEECFLDCLTLSANMHIDVCGDKYLLGDGWLNQWTVGHIYCKRK